MTRGPVRSRRIVLVLTVLLAVNGLGGGAGDPGAETGYTGLFNGKDLTGWYYKTSQGKEDLTGKSETSDRRFQVADGLIVANPGRGIKALTTTRDFDRDFHLKLEFRAAPRADSGVYLRGKQLQVRDYPTVGPYKNLTRFQ